ncbi:MAG: hypothetical protein KAG99_01410 [Bacteroidales bacterium]|nr:hypothetical protein [Bacteroidales bacterium]
MILRFFKKNFVLQLVLFFLFAVLLWLDGFISPKAAAENWINTPIYRFIIHFFGQLPAVIGVLFAFVLLLSQALILNQTIINTKLMPRNTFMLAFIYVLLMSYSPDSLRLHPVLIANFFLILSFRTIINIYNLKEPYIETFNAGLLFAIASLIYIPSLLFIIFLGSLFMIYRIYDIRVWIISVVGLITPFLFIFTYYFWFEQPMVFFEEYVFYFKTIQPFDFENQTTYYVFGAVISFLTLISLGKIVGDSPSKVINIRKILGLIIAFVFITLITYVYAGSFSSYHVMISFIPISIMVTYFCMYSKGKILSEIFVTILILLILAGKFIA